MPRSVEVNVPSRPRVDSVSIWDVRKVEVRRDLVHHTLDIICHGEDKYWQFNITVWSDGESDVPEVTVLPDRVQEKELEGE